MFSIESTYMTAKIQIYKISYRSHYCRLPVKYFIRTYQVKNIRGENNVNIYRLTQLKYSELNNTHNL